MGWGRRCSVLCFLLFMAAVFDTTTARSAERRVALIVGASAYRAVPPLRNTLNDARGMTSALRRLDFEVDTVLDPDRAHFEAAVRHFGERARAADLAVFYYAGHAVEANGRNWLLPVSADPKSGRDLRFEAMELDGILEQLDGAARLSVVILELLPR